MKTHRDDSVYRIEVSIVERYGEWTQVIHVLTYDLAEHIASVMRGVPQATKVEVWERTGKTWKTIRLVAELSDSFPEIRAILANPRFPKNGWGEL